MGYLNKLENELLEVKGHSQSFSSDEVNWLRKVNVDLISGKSNRVQSDFWITLTVFASGILIGTGGLVLESMAAIVFGGGVALIGGFLVVPFYMNKAQSESLTKMDRLSSLKRVYDKGLISSQEYHDAVNYVANGE